MIVAVQDQAVSTNHFKRNVLKEEITNKCQVCEQYEETADHVISGKKQTNKKQYDNICTHLHYSMCKKLGTETTEYWYLHLPEPPM
jgi:hypothetical protein